MQYLQTESSECGLVCLAFASAKLGAEIDIGALRRKYPVGSRGLTVRQLADIATGIDLLARPVRCELNELKQLKLPAILHWSFNHFVVLVRVEASYLIVHDPAQGLQKISLDEANDQFTGVAIEVSEAPTFQRRREPSPLSIWAWIRLTPALKSGLAQLLMLSVLLQIYVIASPYYMQLAIDQGALKGDKALLTTLAIGFGLFGLFNLVASVLRSLVTQAVAAHVSWDMGLRLFRHMVRLPLGWFQRRKLADTISRFDSVNPIRDLVSGGLIPSLIDGMLAITTLVMLFLYAPPLGLCAAAGATAYVIIRVASVPTALRLSSEVLGAQIAENGARIETIKAIQSIKSMSAENSQETQWSNRYASFVTRTLDHGRFATFVANLGHATELVVATAIIYLGARSVLAGTMTVGALYAFMAYRTQFSGAVSNVTEQLIQWKLSDIYSYRLADIVLMPREAGIGELVAGTQAISGAITLRGLSFRYSPYEPMIFQNLNMVVKAGEFVAIVGPSGIGKTSLLKVMGGLYLPTEGEVLIGGRSLQSWGVRAIRDSYSFVLQDDELLSGTIAENVAFFDSNLDMERVWECLGAAALRSEVEALPMKTESLVGDMGGSLSGGQKQRLLIARALYKRPQILFMDEATSHLDAANEALINNELRKLNITRIIVAHRAETIRAADRIFDLTTGQFITPGEAPVAAPTIVNAIEQTYAR